MVNKMKHVNYMLLLILSKTDVYGNEVLDEERIFEPLHTDSKTSFLGEL